MSSWWVSAGIDLLRDVVDTLRCTHTLAQSRGESCRSKSQVDVLIVGFDKDGFTRGSGGGGVHTP